MSRISFNRKRAKLKAVMGIRARLVLLALILVVPLMVERVRSLEDTRVKTIAEINHAFDKLAERTVEAQREVIFSVEAILKSASHIYLSGARLGDACGLMRASLPANLPWIRNVLVLDANGRVTCASVDNMDDINLGDRDYFKRAKAERKLVISNYIFSRVSKLPTAVLAYPVSPTDTGNGSVIIAGINLDWMSKVMDNLGGRPGVSAVLIDNRGTVLATSSDQASMIGNPVDDLRLLPAIEKSGASESGVGRLHFTAANGKGRLISFTHVAGASSSLVVSIDEAAASAAINREIRTAYVQSALSVSLFCSAR